MYCADGVSSQVYFSDGDLDKYATMFSFDVTDEDSLPFKLRREESRLFPANKASVADLLGVFVNRINEKCSASSQQMRVEPITVVAGILDNLESVYPVIGRRLLKLVSGKAGVARAGGAPAKQNT